MDIEHIARLTDGIGADGVIITAATPSHDVISTAFQMCRKKGRVVLVGDVGLNLNRADFYQKELDFFISTSYGPGRYDHWNLAPLRSAIGMLEQWKIGILGSGKLRQWFIDPIDKEVNK